MTYCLGSSLDLRQQLKIKKNVEISTQSFQRSPFGYLNFVAKNVPMPEVVTLFTEDKLD